MAYLTPCSYGCPVKTNVPGYVDSIINGDYAEAFKIIEENNPFPSVCAWVCPHPCEDNCRRAKVDAPVNIRALKRFAVEKGRKSKYTQRAGNCLDQKGNIPGGDIAIIGAGPSGLTAAHDLVQRGFTVTVFDRHDEPGGHFFASIPVFRLPREVLSGDIAMLQESGVDIRCGFEVGKDAGLEELRGKYRAVVLAVGMQESKMLSIPGGEHPAVLPALPFLQRANSGNPMPVGRSVIVIGGGDVAMDVARTALRQGGSEANVVCLESPEEMPAHAWEVQEAREEGVRLYTGLGPKEILLSIDEGVQGLEVQKVMQVFDKEGRFNPCFDTAQTKVINGDNVIVSVGQAASLSWVRGHLQLDSRGNLVVDRDTLAAGEDGFFACGEVAQGPGAAVSAIASGHKVAENVAAYLSKIGPRKPEAIAVLGDLPDKVSKHIITHKRRNLKHLKPETRVKSFGVFEMGFNEENALTEASRCLRCGLGAEVDISLCIGCLTCQRICPYGVPAVESKASISPDICQACGMCAAACPAGAITIPGLKRESDGDSYDVFSNPANPPMVIYACRKTVGRHILPGTVTGYTVLNNAVIRVLPCIGSLRKDTLLTNFARGVWGVALISCSEGCTSGSLYNAGRDAEFKASLTLLGEIGIDAGRLAHLNAENQESVINKLTDFAQKVATIGSLW